MSNQGSAENAAKQLWWLYTYQNEQVLELACDHIELARYSQKSEVTVKLDVDVAKYWRNVKENVSKFDRKRIIGFGFAIRRVEAMKKKNYLMWQEKEDMSGRKSWRQDDNSAAVSTRKNREQDAQPLKLARRATWEPLDASGKMQRRHYCCALLEIKKFNKFDMNV